MTDHIKQLDYIIEQLKSFETAAEKARSHAATALAHEMEGNARIRAWLVAANAGALLICFNTMLGGQICDWIAVRPLILVFVAGLASAFFSVVADRRAHSVYRTLMVGAEALSAKATAQAKEFEAARPSVVSGDTDAAMKALRPVGVTIDELNARSKQLDKIDTNFWHTASGWLELGSVAALACGLVWSVSDATFIQALCSSMAQVETPGEQQLPNLVPDQIPAP